jgi:septal ring factor EnvC (AmiA/AmiB activator)
MADDDAGGLRDRIARQSEDALGKLAQDLLENPLVNGAITRAFSAREHAVHAQEAAMGALNIPSAADIERLTKRLRSVSQRLEGVEDRLDGVQTGVDRLSSQLEAAARGSDPGVADRLAGVEAQLTKLTLELGHVANALDASPSPVHLSQERLAVDGPPAKPARKPAAAKKPAATKKK